MNDSPPPLSREKLRVLRSLSSTRIRKRRELCIVEGDRALGEARRAGALVYLVTSGGQGVTRFDTAFHGIDLFLADDEVFSGLSDVGTGTGLLGVARTPPLKSPSELLELSGEVKLFFLDGLQEPGNVGGLVRTAWALGFSGVVLGKGTADPFSRKGIRASAGSVFHLPLYRSDQPSDLVSLVDGGFSCFLAEAGGGDYRRISYPEKSILALGNEGGGFSPETREAGVRIGIPMAQGADSLNVVVAGSLIASRMMEVVRDANRER